jgi:hypothetical protein
MLLAGLEDKGLGGVSSLVLKRYPIPESLLEIRFFDSILVLLGLDVPSLRRDYDYP